MASNTNPQQQQDSWTDGMSQFAEAARHQMTASRLAIAGMVALGAAATAYLWDERRRSDLMDSGKRWSDQLTSFWNNAGSAGGGNRGDTGNGGRASSTRAS